MTRLVVAPAAVPAAAVRRFDARREAPPPVERVTPRAVPEAAAERLQGDAVAQRLQALQDEVDALRAELESLRATG